MARGRLARGCRGWLTIILLSASIVAACIEPTDIGVEEQPTGENVTPEEQVLLDQLAALPEHQ